MPYTINDIIDVSIMYFDSFLYIYFVNVYMSVYLLKEIVKVSYMTLYSIVARLDALWYIHF